MRGDDPRGTGSRPQAYPAAAPARRDADDTLVGGPGQDILNGGPGLNVIEQD